MKKVLRPRALTGLTLAILAVCPTIATAETVTERIARVFDEFNGQAASCPEDLDRFGVPDEADCVKVSETFKQVRRAFRREFDQNMSPLSDWSREGGYRARVILGVSEVFTVAHNADTGVLAAVPYLPCPIDPNVHSDEEENYQHPKVTDRILPDHPAEARAANKGGVVVARLLIRQDGNVGQICLISVDPPGYGFDQAAVQAFGQWRFEPATLDGTAVASYSIQYVAWSISSP